MIEVKKDFIEINGEKVFIYGGDLSYCRIPRRSWKERILQMKAAGMNTVAFYAVWAYHQPEPDVFDFSGERDIAAFIDTIAECGMYCIFRMGPFVHGEFRNGGLPGWVVERLGSRARTNDPEYLQYTEQYYRKLIDIAVSRQITNGGPIIIVQLENELGSAGCKGDDLPRGSADEQENLKHLLFYYEMIRRAGITVPLLDINHVPDKELHFSPLVDSSGFYPVNCFYCDGTLPDFSLDWWQNHTRPCITIETGGGMFARYFDTPPYRNTNSFQGPLVPPEFIEAAVQTHLADGCSGVNFYIFSDGQNPDDCGENMLPAKDMNYQAPITVAGRLRPSYYAVKRYGWFLRSFGREMLNSAPDSDFVAASCNGIPHPGTQNGGDLFANYGCTRNMESEKQIGSSSLKVAARTTKGLNLSESNFVFLRNAANPAASWQRDIRLLTSPSKLASEVWQEYPKKIQLEMPPQTVKTMPFFIRLAPGNFLEYSTAELLDKREFNGKTQVVLYDSKEVMSEIRLVLPETESFHTSGNVLVLRESPNTVTLIARAERLPIVFETGELRIVLVEKEYAERLWDIGDLFAWSADPLYGSADEICCRTEQEDFCMEWMTTQVPSAVQGLADSSITFDPERSIVRITGRFERPAPRICWQKKFVGEDIVFSATIDPSLLDNVEDTILTIRHDGMIGQAFFNGKLVSDHPWGKFLIWEIALREFLTGPGELKIVCTRALRSEISLAVQTLQKINFIN